MLPKNKAGNLAGTRTITNNLGLRGVEQINPDQPFAGTRIICLGDSVTFGYSVSGNEHAYPAVLEGLLRKELSRVQVINADEEM